MYCLTQDIGYQANTAKCRQIIKRMNAEAIAAVSIVRKAQFIQQ